MLLTLISNLGTAAGVVVPFVPSGPENDIGLGGDSQNMRIEEWKQGEEFLIEVIKVWAKEMQY